MTVTTESRPVSPLVRFGVGLVATALLAYLALLLGAWAFGYRRYDLHERRLHHMLQENPNLAQVMEGLRNDGTPLVAAPTDAEAVARVAAQYGREKAAEIVATAARWPVVRVFRAGDMMYFIYFDQAGVMRAYLYVSR